MVVLFLSAASSIHTVKWVNSLAERGHEVHLAYLKGHEPKPDSIDGRVKLCPLPFSGGAGYYLNAPALKKLAKSIRPDVINVHYASGYGTLSRVAGLKHVLLSVWGSDVYEFPYQSALKHRILKKNVKAARYLASTSHCMAEQLRRVMADDGLEIAITPFGVDIEKFSPRGCEDNGDRIVLGNVKALKPIYGIDDFINACSFLKKRLESEKFPVPFTVEIYGDGEQKEELLALIKELSLEDTVFLKGRVANDLVPEVLGGIDIFCATSRHESFGVAVVEAMAMGKAVVVTDADGFREVTVDGETGFVVPKGDIEAISDALYRLIKDKQLRSHFGKAGRARAEQLYDWQKNVDTMEQLYLSIKEKKRPSEKRCIFHIPNYIDKNATSGSHIRPVKMIEGFKSLGYDVDVIMGYGRERKEKIKEIKQNIKNGVKYDFLYSESSTMPTLLTEKNHFPRYPFLDFGFFKFCKRHGIKIGLFYRDVYWKFPIYKNQVSLSKRLISIPMYNYDLRRYRKLLDVFYLPSIKMKKYADVGVKTFELPPGCNEINGEVQPQKESGKLRLFYVGGIGSLYDLTRLFEAVKALPFVTLTVCCRVDEWQARKEYYEPNMCDRIKIVHAYGDELEKYYTDADICMLFFEGEEYRNFAMPIKLFEYLANSKTIIATDDTAAGDFVEKNDIGWKIPFDCKALSDILTEIYNNKALLEEKKSNIQKAQKNNTWQARAEQVKKDLYKGE